MKFAQMTFLTAATLSLCAGSARAWWDEGHMRVAAIAYELLTPNAKEEANRLIRLNPNYGEWVASVPPPLDGGPKDTDRYTFIRASAWADDIKTFKAYRDASKDDAATTATAGRNIGYADHLIHGYWHFKDLPFTPDGAIIPPADPVDAVTQIKLFTVALPASSGNSDDVRSYDLVWLLHLVGDIHQPLHAAAMFAKPLSLKHQMLDEPDTGDRGGNEIMVSPADGQVVNLHAFWDGMFGGYSTVDGAIQDTFTTRRDKRGRAIPKVLWALDTLSELSDPDEWARESFDLAKRYAYAEPVASGKNVIELTRQYESNARAVAESQTALAAARLANLLNNAFP